MLFILGRLHGTLLRCGGRYVLQVGMDLEQLTIAHTREVFDPTMVLEPILQHPLQLQSAYMEVTGAEPDFTSSHDRFHGTVDYIWYTPEVSCKLVNIKHVSVPTDLVPVLMIEHVFTACCKCISL